MESTKTSQCTNPKPFVFYKCMLNDIWRKSTTINFVLTRSWLINLYSLAKDQESAKKHVAAQKIHLFYVPQN